MDIPCILYGENRRRACRINAYEGILGAGRGDAAVGGFQYISSRIVLQIQKVFNAVLFGW